MKFKIDIKIFAFIILFYFTKQIELYALIMIFALIHELGHLTAGILLRMKPERLELMPVGVRISFKIKELDYNKKIKKANMLEIKKIAIAIAGPLTNLIIILIISIIKVPEVQKEIITYTNYLIMIFNLIPIYPLDGGRILKGILYIMFGKEKSEKYTNNISKTIMMICCATSSILILYTKNIAIFLISIYLVVITVREELKYQKRKKLYSLIKTIKNT